MKKIFYISIALLIPVLGFTQENIFVIYSAKGNVSIIENKVESKAKIGTFVNDNSTLKIGAGSFATLLCNEKNMFSVSKSGNYTISNFKDSCKSGKSSMSSNYLKYVWTELTKSKEAPEKNRKYYMSNVGAVSRGDINNVWVDPRLDTVLYVSGTIPLSWKSYTDAENFVFRLYDESGNKIVLSKETNKKHVDVSEILKSLQPGKVYYWAATIKDEPENQDKKYFRYVPKEEYNTYFNAIKKHDEAPESDAEMNFRMGFVLEEHHYVAEAYNHYLNATQLDPDNGLYRFTFMSFKKDYEVK